jgi:hypothetical protein
MTFSFRRPIFLLWLCAFAWWAGRWFWVWWPVPATVALRVSEAPVADGSRLGAAPVFGSKLGQNAVSDYRLVGLSTDRTQGFALIQGNGKLQAYMRGDALPDGRKVADLTRDGALLERGGVRDTLPLVRPGH